MTFLKVTAIPFLRIWLLCVITSGACYIVVRQILPPDSFGGQLWRPFVLIGAVMPAMVELMMFVFVLQPRWYTVRESQVYSTAWQAPVKASQIERVVIDLGFNPAPCLRVEHRSPTGRRGSRYLFLADHLDLDELKALLPMSDAPEPADAPHAGPTD